MIDFIKDWFTGLRNDKSLLLTIGAFISIWIVSGILEPAFFSADHIKMVLYLNTTLGIMALAQTLAVLSGGIDMSVGSIFWFVIMSGAVLMGGESLWLPLLICLVLGVLVGLANGIGISLLNIHPVVMTLATAISLSGVVYVATGGGGRGGAAPGLSSFSIMRVGGVPVITIVWIILTVLLYFLLNRTILGKKMRALGSNPQACISAGVRLWKVRVAVYSIGGFLAAIAGLFYLGWAHIPYPALSPSGLGLTDSLQTIAAVVIGGTLFNTGRGGVGRTFIGVLTLAFLYSVLSMLGLGSTVQQMLTGAIIVVVVSISGKIPSR